MVARLLTRRSFSPAITKVFLAKLKSATELLAAKLAAKRTSCLSLWVSPQRMVVSSASL